MKNSTFIKSLFLLLCMIAGGIGSAWADEPKGIIYFGTTSGYTNVNATSVTGNDSQGNTWTITTSGTTSFTTNQSYSQIGSSKNPASSITFTTTLSEEVNVTLINARFGGFSGTAGTVTLKVGDTTVGTGSLDATNNVTISSTSAEVGNVITVTVTDIAKGVKAFYIEYTYEAATPASPLVSIALSGTYPTTFYQGDTFSHEGMTVTATYEDESTKDVTAKAEFTGYNMSDTGNQTVTVSYTEGEVTRTAEYGITISAPATLSSISLSGDYQTVFTEGDTFNHDGLVVTANYSDNTQTVVTDDAEFSIPDMSQVGEQTITVTYNEVSTTYDITINAIPTHNVTWSINGATSSESYKEGAAINFPENPADVNDKTFVGWVTETIDGTTNEAPTFVTSATMGESDIIYYAVFAYASGSGSADVVDELNRELTEVSGTNYAGWTGKTATSTAVYAGNSAGGNNAIQLRSNNSNSGIVTTASGGKVKKVVITWDSNTTATRTVSIYGKNSAYSAASDLYSSATQGTLLGELNIDNASELTSELTISDDYEYIGIRSKSGALYLDEVQITWSTGGGVSYSDYCTTVVAAAVAKPTIEVAANPFLFSTTATIACETEGATIKYSFDGDNWNNYEGTLTITATTTLYAKAVKDENESTIASVTITKNLAEPTVTIDAEGITNTNVFDGTAAGSLAASVTYNDAAVEGAEVTWSADNDEVATIDASTGAVTLVGAGSVTFTATYAGNSDYAEKTATYEMTVTNNDPNAPGTQNNPYTVAEARAAIDAGEGVTNVYATGIVSEIVEAYSSAYGNISYNISADGLTTSDQLQAFRGKSYNGDDFTSADDIQVGDVVVVYGNLTNYKGTYEFAQNNQLVSLMRKTVPGLEWSVNTFDAVEGEENVYPTLTNTNGVEVTYSSSDETVATIANDGTITLVANGETTITAAFAGNSEYLEQEVSYTLTVTGFSKDAAGIAFAESEVNITYGDEFEGQALTNPNNLTVVYTSSDDDVALVDETTGEVVIGKAGSATITATFTENDDYLGAVVSYTINVAKAAAGLSFDETSFKVAPDAEFEAPTLNNPNGLTVTYTSSDEDIVYVDDTTGEVLIFDEGTVTITAAFAGDDNYLEGNASYTIVVTSELDITWDLSKDKTTTATTTEMSWVATQATMRVDKANSSTATNNYYPGSNNRTSTRFYNGSKLTITSGIGYEITSVEFTATTDGYATALKNSTWTNAEAAASETTVTVTPTDGLKAMTATIGGTCGFTSVKVNYKNATSAYITLAEACTDGEGMYYGTFSSPKAFVVPEDIVVSEIGIVDNTLYIEEYATGNVVPANTGVMVSSTTAGDHSVVLGTGGTSVLGDDNSLRASGNGGITADDMEAADSNCLFYRLTMHNGSELGFWWGAENGAAFTIAANKAYLAVPKTVGARIQGFSFDDGIVTGIANMNREAMINNGSVYNMKGQRVAQPAKGLYIQNGKKVVVK